MCFPTTAGIRWKVVILPEESNSTFDNNCRIGETTVRYYNEDVWEELVDVVTFEEAIRMLDA